MYRRALAIVAVVAAAAAGDAPAGPYDKVTAAPAAIETDVTPQVVNHCAPNCAEDAQGLSHGKGGETVGYSTEAQIQNTQQGKINIGTRK